MLKRNTYDRIHKRYFHNESQSLLPRITVVVSTCISPIPETSRRDPDLPDHGVIGGGDLVEDAVDTGQFLLVLDSDAVVSLVVVLQGATEVPEGGECLLGTETNATVHIDSEWRIKEV